MACVACSKSKRGCSVSDASLRRDARVTRTSQPALPPTLSSRLNDIAITVDLARKAEGSHADGASSELRADFSTFLRTYPDWKEWEDNHVAEGAQAGPSSG
ncbi:hypothetical protein CYLTODRAFT_415455 [Cylindrobasidium torrendii FP15055 ss-10]|uniref:Uncharacterized protein n=1 Tax=Cylindrobasidium torrendii FP15055 ss-10 TaxID=1314674 RepID=A0A0D7ASR6_9AGAR|nr:hypothetical protein CYLTODRAFT_415455 [Cylindrobasidium torrendii FP15055 ss-10]